MLAASFWQADNCSSLTVCSISAPAKSPDSCFAVVINLNVDLMLTVKRSCVAINHFC